MRALTVLALHASRKIKQCILKNHSSWATVEIPIHEEKKTYPFHIFHE